MLIFMSAQKSCLVCFSLLLYFPANASVGVAVLVWLSQKAVFRKNKDITKKYIQPIIPVYKCVGMLKSFLFQRQHTK